jgi:hypothetical protein
MAAVEAAAEVVEAVGEETLEAAETIRRFTGENVSFFTGGVIFGALAGGGLGYLVLSKRFKTKYERIADEEIAGMRDHYDRKLRALDNKEEKEVLDQVVKQQRYAVEGDGKVAYHRVGSEPDKPSEDDQPEALVSGQNVFEAPKPVVETPGWDYETELADRKDKHVFVIHRDEYMENKWEYGTSDLTYFEGDDVLSDSSDRVVDEQDIVGIENLGKFGHGSNDPDIVYVCNTNLSMLFEITHSDGSYSMEVHGMPSTDDELQHSSMRRRPPRGSRYDDSD